MLSKDFVIFKDLELEKRVTETPWFFCKANVRIRPLILSTLKNTRKGEQAFAVEKKTCHLSQKIINIRKFL
jgi:hypothetical protein